jgi:hypothetical protein
LEASAADIIAAKVGIGRSGAGCPRREVNPGPSSPVSKIHFPRATHDYSWMKNWEESFWSFLLIMTEENIRVAQ